MSPLDVFLDEDEVAEIVFQANHIPTVNLSASHVILC
jgi:hypothetical protein